MVSLFRLSFFWWSKLISLFELKPHSCLNSPMPKVMKLNVLKIHTIYGNSKTAPSSTEVKFFICIILQRLHCSYIDRWLGFLISWGLLEYLVTHGRPQFWESLTIVTPWRSWLQHFKWIWYLDFLATPDLALTKNRCSNFILSPDELRNVS